MIALIAGAVSAFLVALVGTPILIRWLRGHGIGQPIHDDVRHHSTKAGTPTMGGLLIPIGLLIGFPVALLVTGERPTALGISSVAVIVAMGLVGLLDDWMKVRRERNLGLRERQKTILQLAISLGYGLIVLTNPDTCHQLSATRCAAAPFHVPPTVFLLAIVALFWLTTNAVNFTDGIEGLLAGSSSVTFLTLAGISYWIFRHPAIYQRSNPLELGVIAAALAAAACGLLWWNISPRTIFMGDTGSLALGAGLVVVTVGLGVSLLIPIIGALYVAEGASSFLQRFWFKWTKHRGSPRRLLRMAPVHHHFELVGWNEVTVVIRFWIINGVAAAIGIAIFYADALGYLPSQ
jgi:phospho-N-acetylmuramoyl-pentapeptide-transferase